MANNGTAYTKDGKVYHLLTNTHQVLNPDGSRLEQRLTDDESALKGKGDKANAKDYPFRYLGEYNSITALNTALNEIFYTTDEKWQGNLRAFVNGQMVFIHQIGIYIARGDWAQVVIGCVAPSSDNTLLVASGTPNILWRSRDSGGSTVVRNDWQTIASVNLKTVNGQSLIGEGDIEISGSGGSITKDSELDTTSTNAIQNKPVSLAIQALQAAIDGVSASEGGVIVCKQWKSGSFDAGSEGDYAYNTASKKLYKYVSNAWDEQEEHPKSGVIYIDSQTHASYFWESSDMQPLLSEATLSSINTSSSAPVNSTAVKNYVDENSKAIELAYICTSSSQSLPTQAGEATVEDGVLGFDYANDKIKKYSLSSDTWTDYANPKTDVMYVLTGTNEYYHYDYGKMIAFVDERLVKQTIPSSGGDSMIPTVSAVRNYVGSAIDNIDGGGGSSESSERTVKGFGTDNYGDPLFPEYYLPVTYDGDTVLLGTLYNSDVAAEKAAADAYIATIKWGINFYDWPLRCYNGTVSGVTVKSGTADAIVFAPSEHCLYRVPGIEISYTTDDVYYNSTTHSFVLRFNEGTSDNPTYAYYAKWKNSDEWNNRQTNKARRDCVYSDISVDAEHENTYTRTTKVFEYSDDDVTLVENSFESITEYMTDFTAAIRTCMFTSDGKDGGAMRMSDRIYFMGFSSSLSFYRGDWTLRLKSNFVIDGGRGVLFVRYRTNRSSMAAGQVNSYAGSVISFRGTHDCEVKNITIRMLRDRDNCQDGSSGDGMRPELSSSDSWMNGFNFSSANSADTESSPSATSGSNVGDSYNISLKNIDIRGANHDLWMHNNTHDIVVDGWKSREGWQNVIRAKRLTIRNADYVQRRYAQGRMHVFYFQAGMEDILVEDSYFAQEDEYSCVMFDAAHGDATEQNVPKGFVLKRCTIEGNRLFTAHGNYSEKEKFVLEDCTLRQKWDMMMDQNSIFAANEIIGANKADFILRNCLIEIKRGHVFGTSNTNDTQIICLQNCGVYTETPNDGYIAPSNYGGGCLTLENVTSNFESERVRTRVGESDIVVARSTAGLVKEINEELFGNQGATYIDGEAQTRADLPLEGENGASLLGKKYHVIETDELAECTSQGVFTRFQINLADLNLPSESTTTHVDFYLNTNEHITFDLPITTSSTIASLKSAITDILAGMDYSRRKTTTKGSVYNASLRIGVSAKNIGSGNTIPTGSSNGTIINSPTTYLKVYATKSGYEDARYRAGTDTEWDFKPYTYSGLVESVENLQTQVANNATKTNDVDDRVTSLETKVKPSTPIAGRTADRPNPSVVGVGYCYFDIELGTLGKAIFSTGSGWVYADGTAVV